MHFVYSITFQPGRSPFYRDSDGCTPELQFMEHLLGIGHGAKYIISFNLHHDSVSQVLSLVTLPYRET